MTRLAYIISAYKLPEQLVRLVDRLDSPSASFFIHVDKKSPSEVHARMTGELEGRPNVTFLPRHRCDWGGFGHVAATLEGISSIVKGRNECDYVVLLTGQDYPIKSPDEIEAFFARQSPRLFLDNFPLPHPDWDRQGLDRIEAWYIRLAGRRIVVDPPDGFPLRRRFPLGMQPYGGSSYWNLTGECVAYIHSFARANPGFVNFFKYVEVPDELFFQTIVMNSPFRGDVVNEDLRFIEWRDERSASPAVLTASDFDKIVSSPDLLFARKFDVTVDAEILDAIDSRILATASSVTAR